MQKTIHILLNPLPSKQQNKTKPTKTLSLFLFWIFQVLFINRKSLADVVPFQSWTSNVFICCAKSACKTKTKTNIKKALRSGSASLLGKDHHPTRANTAPTTDGFFYKLTNTSFCVLQNVTFVSELRCLG